ncbi:MAG: hypothetical protein P8X95_22530, partial [Anaerolineales bacterium]
MLADNGGSNKPNSAGWLYGISENLCKQYGLSVTSNYLMIGQDDVRPIPMLYGIKEYPIFF